MILSLFQTQKEEETMGNTAIIVLQVSTNDIKY